MLKTPTMTGYPTSASAFASASASLSLTQARTEGALSEGRAAGEAWQALYSWGAELAVPKKLCKVFDKLAKETC